MRNLWEILKELGTLLIAGAVACVGYGLLRLADTALDIGSVRGFALSAAAGVVGYLIYRLGAWMWSK
jgi:hypothetical protein